MVDESISSPSEVTLQIFRGNGYDPSNSHFQTFKVPYEPGMVVLNAIHYIQAHVDPSLSARWNCKAGRCGSCAAEIDGIPRLLCKTPVKQGEAVVVVEPMKAFPHVRDLVTDVSDNWKVANAIPPFTSKESTDHVWKFYQRDVERSRELRKCIECFLCQDVCHVLREHKADYIGPRFVVKVASLDLHPMDALNRSNYLKNEAAIGYCNITKCCQEICPEHIIITDDAIIPEKERVVDTHYDPLVWLYRLITNPAVRVSSASHFFSIVRRLPGMKNVSSFEQLVKRLLRLVFWALILLPLIVLPLYFLFSTIIKI